MRAVWLRTEHEVYRSGRQFPRPQGQVLDQRDWNVITLIRDHETRNTISVVDVGSRRYFAEAPELLCTAWRMKDGTSWGPVRVAIGVGGSDGRAAVERRVRDAGWQVASLADFRADYAACDRAVAHNVGFEIAGEEVLFPGLPWKPPSCTAARARRLGLPGSLKDACRVLRTPHQKSLAGHVTMLQVSQPRPHWVLHGTGGKWFEDSERLAKTAIYCCEDILAECDLDDYLPELSDTERQYWLHVEKINRRGIRLDAPLLEAMRTAVEADVRTSLERARKVTGNPEFALTNPQLIRDFCASRRVLLNDLRKETVAAALAGALPDDVRVVLEARSHVGGKSSTAKIPRMLGRIGADGKARDIVIYGGAHTLRNTGDGINTLNLPRPYKGFDQDKVIAALLEGRPESIRTEQGVSVSNGVSAALRGVVIPDPGNKFVVGDYSSVEPCFAFTLARQWDAVEVLRRKESLYIDFGKVVYGRELDKNKDLIEYTVCKSTILGCGYGMGADRFYDYLIAAGVIIEREESNRVHAAYRARFHKIPDAWNGLGEASKSAIRSPGSRCSYNGVTYVSDGWWLVCELPSGRPFYYPNARLQPGKYSDEIVYEGWVRIDGRPAGWGNVRTWGGSLLENVTQAACRDIMEEHQQEVEALPGWQVDMTVYDEIVAECPQNCTNAKEVLASIMSRPPTWMKKMPVSASVTEMLRYRKE